MMRRTWLVSFAMFTTIATVPVPAYAGTNLGCFLEELASGVIGITSMAVDLGFTINAIVKGVQGPGYSNATDAGWQVGLMVPQIVFTGSSVLYLAKVCPDARPALVIAAIPLGWSLALLGHGIWTLHKDEQDAPSNLQPLSLSIPTATAGPRLRLLPAAPGPGAIGLRLQGQF